MGSILHPLANQQQLRLQLLKCQLQKLQSLGSPGWSEATESIGEDKFQHYVGVSFPSTSSRA